MKTLTEKEQRRKDYLKEYNKKYRALYAKELDKKCWESRKRKEIADEEACLCFFGLSVF